jgi:glucose-6-phosphate isomerase
MARFNEYPAFRKLQELARTPFDLTAPGALTAQRLESYRAEACGWRLLYGTERVNEQVLQALDELAGQADAHRWMERMQAGEVINQIEGFESERREVLHTAMRDLFDHPRSEPAAVKATAQARRELEKLQQFLAQIEGKFTDLIQIGIGGSDLGPRAFAIALQAFAQKGRRAHFFSNVDPDDAARVLRGVDLRKTLVVVVSKSGTTLETLTNETLARSAFEKAGLNPRDHFIAVTGEKSPMDNPARYLASFYIWDYVGGRYSVTSMVGLVALGFLIGHQAVLELLRGAHDMDRTACAARLQDNLPLLGALLGIWNRNFLKLPTVAVLPYSQALERFPAHLQQCNMESNGKHVDRHGQQVAWETGPVVWGEPGTNGQHSFYQLIHQGTDIIPCELIGLRESQYGQDLQVEGTTSQEKLLANLFAQSLALATGKQDKNPNRQFEGNRPNHLLLAQKLTPYALGALMSYYEHKIAFQGFIWGINSFDQEGVQLGKVMARQFIDQFAARRKGEKTADWPVGQALLKQL